MEKLYFADDLAERYKVSVRKAKELLRTMPAMKIGARMAVAETALAAWERERTRAQAATPKRGRKPKAQPIVRLEEMRCPTRRELRELAKAK